MNKQYIDYLTNVDLKEVMHSPIKVKRLCREIFLEAMKDREIVINEGGKSWNIEEYVSKPIETEDEVCYDLNKESIMMFNNPNNHALTGYKPLKEEELVRPKFLYPNLK